jgi:ABC-2 type transport system ATP-binding protein
MVAISTSNLRKTYGDVTALADLSLSIEAGELFGALGPNGAGKTTTIKILTGQLQPDGGSASVLGYDPVAEPVETRRHIGILPEQESPPSFLTPREYFDFVGTVRDIPEDVVADRVATWTDRLSYAEKLDTMSTDLSRGQQQKVMITQAFLHEPEVVFIESYRDDGNTIFISTHHIEVAEELCTRVGIVSGGELIAERRPSELGRNESLLDTFLENVGGAGTTVEGLVGP